MSFDATPAFSRAANTFFMRVVASAFALERLGSCASTPRTMRATSGAAVTRPSPEAWTVRGTGGSGETWARSRKAARAGIMGGILLLRLRPGSVGRHLRAVAAELHAAPPAPFAAGAREDDRAAILAPAAGHPAAAPRAADHPRRG